MVGRKGYRLLTFRDESLIFDEVANFQSKSRADEIADRYRKKGYYARITKDKRKRLDEILKGTRHSVWIRKKSTIPSHLKSKRR